MPELPEVETILQGLARRISGKLVTHVRVGKAKIVRGSVRAFVAALTGSKFAAARRHGKLLIFSLQNRQQFLLVHLKMTGQLIYQDKTHTIAGGHQWPPVDEGSLPNKYTHVQFDFADGSTLYFNDVRQFGFMELMDKTNLNQRLAQMGIDPLQQNLRWQDFKRMVSGRKASIKAVLLNQSLIAGIGNIYADEICFAAKIRPRRRTNQLTEKELHAIWHAIPRVLKRALKYGGTTFRDFRDSDGGKGNFTRLLKVYGRAGKKCKRCKIGVIKKIVVAQRGTHYCPNCQK